VGPEADRTCPRERRRDPTTSWQAPAWCAARITPSAAQAPGRDPASIRRVTPEVSSDHTSADVMKGGCGGPRYGRDLPG
jgi:hypothetical protein